MGEEGRWNYREFPLKPRKRLFFFCAMKTSDELKGRNWRFKSVSDSLFGSSRLAAVSLPPTPLPCGQLNKAVWLAKASRCVRLCVVFDGVFGCSLLPVSTSESSSGRWAKARLNARRPIGRWELGSVACLFCHC